MRTAKRVPDPSARRANADAAEPAREKKKSIDRHAASRRGRGTMPLKVVAIAGVLIRNCGWGGGRLSAKRTPESAMRGEHYRGRRVRSGNVYPYRKVNGD